MFVKVKHNMIFKSSKESLIQDIKTKIIFGLVCTGIPISYFFYLPEPVNYVVLPFSLVGIITILLTIRKIIKYIILKQPYEFYVLHIVSDSKRTIKIVKGNEIGLPDSFDDLSIDEENFIAIGNYDSKRSIKSQIEKMKKDQSLDVLNVPSRNEKVVVIKERSSNTKESKVKDIIILVVIIFMIVINPMSYIELVIENKEVVIFIGIFLFIIICFNIFVKIISSKRFLDKKRDKNLKKKD